VLIERTSGDGFVARADGAGGAGLEGAASGASGLAQPRQYLRPSGF
jgi:hypothetical protein